MCGFAEILPPFFNSKQRAASKSFSIFVDLKTLYPMFGKDGPLSWSPRRGTGMELNFTVSISNKGASALREIHFSNITQESFPLRVPHDRLPALTIR